MTGVGAAARRVPLAGPLTIGAQALVAVLLLTLLFARQRGGPRTAAGPGRPRGIRPAAAPGRAGRRPVRHPRPRHPRHPAAADRRRAGDRPDSGRAGGHVPQRRARRAAAARALLGGRGAVAGRCGLAAGSWSRRPAICCFCWPRAATGSPSGAGCSAGRAPERTGRTADGDSPPAPTDSRVGPGPYGPQDRCGGARDRRGGARRAALLRRRVAGRLRQRCGPRQRRRHDLRGEPAGVLAGQPQPARGQGSPQLPHDRLRHPRSVSADRRPRPVRRHDLEAVRAHGHGRPRSSCRDRPASAPRSDVNRINTSISTAEWYAQNWLPLPYPASKVDISGRWRFEPQGRTLVGDRGQNTHGMQYQVESLQVRPTSQQLAAAPAAARRPAARVHQGPGLAAPGRPEHRAPGHPRRTDRLRQGRQTPGLVRGQRRLLLQHRRPGGQRFRGHCPVPAAEGGLLRPLLLLHGGDGPDAGHPGPGRGRFHSRHQAARRHDLGRPQGRTRLARAVLPGHRLDPLRADPEPGQHP